VSWIIFVL